MLIDLKSHEKFRNSQTKFHPNQAIASAVFENFILITFLR